MNGITGRIRRLELAAPNPGDNQALRARIERARARCEAMLTPAEKALRQSPEYLAEKAARQAKHEKRMAELSAGGRKPTLAERIITARELLP